MESRKTLADLLKFTCQAEIARHIGRPRAFVHRLFHGQPLRDESIIPKLAEALNIDSRVLTQVVRDDRARWRKERAA